MKKLDIALIYLLGILTGFIILVVIAMLAPDEHIGKVGATKDNFYMGERQK